MGNLLSCQSISKSFGPQNLFENLTLAINEGDRFGILGPNGSGKSTLLKLLAKLDHVDGGNISMRRDLKLAYLSQNEELDLDLTAEEVLLKSISNENLDSHEKEIRIAKALALVELSAPDQRVRELSGGWRKRLAIAAQIITEPELLLMDEPTNHLDIEGIQWLERFLLRAGFALVLISHDRTFLENVTNRMMEINRRFPQGYFQSEGNYSRFLEKREEHLTSLQRHEDSLANRVRNEMEWLRRGPKARGTKASARIQEANRLITELKEYQSRSRRPAAADIEFSASGRKTKRLLSANNLGKGFEHKQLFSGLSFVLSPGMRIGLLGENGSGKSTVLNILNGSLHPDEGTVEYATDLKVVMFDQQRELLNKDLTIKQTLAPDTDSVMFQGRPLHVASYASRFLFRGDSLNVTVNRLSGGEQARLAIAHLMLQPADVLLLDEPTNDLDIDTLEVLEESLEDFPGAIVLVTHDRLMLDRISKILIGLDPKAGCAMYAECSQWLEARKASRKAETPKAEATQKQVQQPAKKKLSYLEKKEWEQIEKRIEEAEAHLEQCKLELENPSVATDAGKLQAACERLKEAQDAVDRLYERWSELEERNA